MKKIKFQNARGFTLLEVMLTFSIVLAMSFALGSLVHQLRGQLKSAESKYESLEFRNMFTQTLGVLPTCTCQLAANTAPIDVTNASGEFPISIIRKGCLVGSPILAQSNGLVPGTQTALEFETIKLTNVEAKGTPDEYKGKLKVNFRPAPGIPAIRGFEVETHFVLDPSSPNNAKVVQACTFVSGTSNTGAASAVVGSCAAGEFITGITNTGIVCARLPSSAYNSGTPGPGCSGPGCTTADFGPCSGPGCRTNGRYCQGDYCTATGGGSSCQGIGCCAGPTCP